MHFALADCKTLVLTIKPQVCGVAGCGTFKRIIKRSEQCQRTTAQRAAHFSQRRRKQQLSAAPQ